MDFYQFAQNLKKNSKNRCSLSCCFAIITFASTTQEGLANEGIESNLTTQTEVEQGPNMDCTFEDLSILDIQDSKAESNKNTEDFRGLSITRT